MTMVSPVYISTGGAFPRQTTTSLDNSELILSRHENLHGLIVFLPTDSVLSSVPLNTQGQNSQQQR